MLNLILLPCRTSSTSSGICRLDHSAQAGRVPRLLGLPHARVRCTGLRWAARNRDLRAPRAAALRSRLMSKGAATRAYGARSMVYRVVGEGAPVRLLSCSWWCWPPIWCWRTSCSLRRRGLPPPAGSAVDRRTRRLRTLRSLLLGGVFGELRWCAQRPTLVSREVTEDHGRRVRVEKSDMAKCVAAV